MATVGLDVYATHTPVVLGRLRNGPASAVARTARASSLARKYHFGGIRFTAALRGDNATFHAPAPVAVILEAQVRSALSVLVEDEVEAARTAHGAGGAPFDEDAARAAAASRPGNRIESIALGAVHTSLVLSYEIVDADLRGTETKTPMLSVVAPAASADLVAYNARLNTISRGWEITLASGNAVADPVEAVALNMPPLTDTEVELAYGYLALGQGSPVRAGAQLFNDGHHYHTNADSSSRHRAMEGEVLSRLSAAATNLWRASIAVLRNCIWHAGIHFVETNVLLGLAEDALMPERLNATGFGSFSVGLPAYEDLFSRAGSYVAVFNQVIQTATAHGHTIDLSELRATVNALATIGRNGVLPAERPDLPNLPRGPWPPGCDTRPTVLKLYLEPALNKAEPVAAWMFGFYREICSRAGIRATSPEGSLLRSYSLKRAVGNFLGESNRAQEMYVARARYMRTLADGGTLETYTGSA